MFTFQANSYQKQLTARPSEASNGQSWLTFGEQQQNGVRYLSVPKEASSQVGILTARSIPTVCHILWSASAQIVTCFGQTTADKLESAGYHATILELLLESSPTAGAQ